MLAVVHGLASFRSLVEFRSSVRCCTEELWEGTEELWEEEREQIEHLRFLAMQAKRIDELKALALPGKQALPSSKQALPSTVEPSDDAALEDACCREDDTLWDEDIESMQLLKEAAAWDARVKALRSVARANPPSMMASDALELPLALLQDTNLGGRRLERCYKATSNGWSAVDFHQAVDGLGSAIVVGELESGELIGGYNPVGWESRDDYRATPRAFIFCSAPPGELDDSAPPGELNDSERAWQQLSALGPGDVAVFDYARGGPQFGAADLIIGEPLAPVMGGFAGPDTMDDSASAGDLREVRAKLGGSYARLPSGSTAFPTGRLVELEVYCNTAYCGRGGHVVSPAGASQPDGASDDGKAASGSPSVGWWPW